jgi:crossover junction endodeoxyribonuclease RuvC
VENLFHANNVRSALKLGHARGVAMLAAIEAGCELAEYTPAEVKRAVVGYGRAEKPQVGQMVKLLLGMAQVPAPHDAADALAVALCHLHTMPHARAAATALMKDSRTTGARASTRMPRSWRDYRPPAGG